MQRDGCDARQLIGCTINNEQPLRRSEGTHGIDVIITGIKPTGKCWSHVNSKLEARSMITCLHSIAVIRVGSSKTDWKIESFGDTGVSGVKGLEGGQY
jgi:hypothetical protein